jgi:antitoxin MazE
MIISVQRWGTSLAIRIPKSFAAKAQLSQNTDVEISLEGGRIVITSVRRRWKLEELIGAISSTNRHGEVRWGNQTGGEIG